MARSARLLDLLQALRRRRRPVPAAVLAGELGVSLRTIYRDVATLQSQGAPIEGEAGLGYVLRPGYLLPPLMFSEEEIEALVIGLRWAGNGEDPALRGAAIDALARIAAVLPLPLRDRLDTDWLLVPREDPTLPLADLRAAIRAERKLRLRYLDGEGKASDRVVWPFALGYFRDARMLAAWCETRADFRHFRVDRMESVERLDTPLPRPRRTLLAEWRKREGLTA